MRSRMRVVVAGALLALLVAGAAVVYHGMGLWTVEPDNPVVHGSKNDVAINHQREDRAAEEDRRRREEAERLQREATAARPEPNPPSVWTPASAELEQLRREEAERRAQEEQLRARPGEGKKETVPPPPGPSISPDVSSKPGQGSDPRPIVIEDGKDSSATDSPDTSKAEEERHKRELERVLKPPRPLDRPVTEGVDGNQQAEKDCRERLRAKGVYLLVDQPCVDLDDVVKNLATGTYRFNKPESAYVEEPFRVVLALPTATGQDVSRVFSGTPGHSRGANGPHRAVPPSDAARRARISGWNLQTLSREP